MVVADVDLPADNDAEALRAALDEAADELGVDADPAGG